MMIRIRRQGDRLGGHRFGQQNIIINKAINHGHTHTSQFGEVTLCVQQPTFRSSQNFGARRCHPVWLFIRETHANRDALAALIIGQT